MFKIVKLAQIDTVSAPSRNTIKEKIKKMYVKYMILGT